MLDHKKQLSVASRLQREMTCSSRIDSGPALTESLLSSSPFEMFPGLVKFDVDGM
jgi:hypothetical protein